MTSYLSRQRSLRVSFWLILLLLINFLLDTLQVDRLARELVVEKVWFIYPLTIDLLVKRTLATPFILHSGTRTPALLLMFRQMSDQSNNKAIVVLIRTIRG